MKVADFRNRIYEDYKDDEADAEFEKILGEISADQEIEQICLQGNGLTSTHIVPLKKAISSLANLKYLDLGANLGFHGEAAMLSLKQIISDHPKLKLINLEFNKMTDTDMKFLVENNSKELCDKIRSVDFIFTCNEFTLEVLPLIKDKLSPSSLLSVMSGNYHMKKDVELVEKYRKEFLFMCEAQEKASAGLKNVSDENKNSTNNTATATSSRPSV